MYLIMFSDCLKMYFILRLVNISCETFSIELLVLYAFVIFLQVMLVTTASDDIDRKKQFVLLMGVLTVFVELTIPCVVADNLRHESENLQNKIYSCNWLDQSVKFKKMLLMILRRSQEPMVVMSAGFVPCSLNTLWWIEKFIYSVYVLFKK